MKFVTAEESFAFEKRMRNNSSAAAAKKKASTHLPLFFQSFKSAHRDKKTHKKQSLFTRFLIRHYLIVPAAAGVCIAGSKAPSLRFFYS